MSLLYRIFFCCIVMVALLAHPAHLHAQNSVWGTAGKAKKNAGKKVANTKTKLHKFKDHLQNWGLDTAYNKAFLVGGKLNSDGWSGSMNFVKRRSYTTSNFWQVTFSEIKHEKQTKQKGTNATFKTLGNPTSYVYGKINNLYTLQVGFGKEKLLLPGVIEGNLSVSFRYSGGLSLAMLKPYYLKLIYIDRSSSIETAAIEEHKYTRTDSITYLDPRYILGTAKFNKSLNEIDYVPGAYLETAIVITPGRTKNFVQVITLGINASYYYKKLPILIDQKSYPWQASLFAGIVIGKRWK